MSMKWGNLELVRNGQLFFFVTHLPCFTFASIINLLNKNNMKKIAVFMFLFIVVIGITKVIKSRKNDVSTLLLYNIEALAADESNLPTRCFGTGSVDCPRIHTKVEYVFGGYSLEDLY